LLRRSFALHAQLRVEIEGDWAYQRTTAYSGSLVAEQDARPHRRRGAPVLMGIIRL